MSTAPLRIYRFLSQVVLFSSCHGARSLSSGVTSSGPDPPRQISPLLTYAPTQCGTSTSPLNSVQSPLSSPSESTISSVSQVFSPGPSRSIHFQVNDKMSQKAGKVTRRDEVNRGTAETGNLEQCAATVCPRSGSEIHRQPGEDSTPRKQADSHG